MQSRLLIFDFDGTLADTFHLFLQIFDQSSVLYGFRPFDRKNMDHLRTLDTRSILRYHEVPMWKLPAIVNTTRRLMERSIQDVRMFAGIEPAVTRLHDDGFKLALLTSNSRSNVQSVLGTALVSRFNYLECGSSVFGKRFRLKRLLSLSKTAATNAMYIGDEIRDAQAAMQTGIAFGAVSWGYSAIEALLQAGAHEHFLEPQELAAKLTL
jgi:phosphoglycolate phosphatase